MTLNYNTYCRCFVKFALISILLNAGPRSYSQDRLRTVDSILALTRLNQDHVDILNSVARSYSMSDLKKMTEISEIALALADSLHYQKGIADCYLTQSIALHWKSLYAEEIKQLTKALSIYEQIGDSVGIATSHSFIGTIHEQQNSWDLAILYHKKAISMFERLGDLNGQSMATRKLGVTYDFSADKDSAMLCYVASLELARKAANGEGEAQSLNNIGLIYLEKGDYKTAINYFETSLALFQLEHIASRMPAVNRNLAEAYFRSGRLQEALSYAHRASDMADSVDILEAKLEAQTMLANIYAQLRDYKRAYDHIINSKRIQNQLYQSEDALTVSRIEALEANKKMELLKLQQEKELSAANFQNRLARARLVTTTLIAIVVVSVGALIIVSLRARIRRDKQDQQALRDEFNLKLANSELSLLKAQMNPHFIFNSLNSINRYIIKSDAETASNYLTRFSRLIRMILENSIDSRVSLQKEIEAVTLYLEMESLRFEEKFSFEIEVQPGLNVSDIEVPPLIIQPFVENAVWHGLMPMTSKGKIKIFIYTLDNYLVYQIEDNGIGREKSSEINRNRRSGKKSHGMELTSNRLKLLTHNDTIKSSIEVVDIKSVDEHLSGTRVLIKLPLDVKSNASQETD